RPQPSSQQPPPQTPALTSTQVTALAHWPQGVKLNELPALNPVHHRPVCSTRPVMSLRPSPSKSPTLTSTQVTVVGQGVPQGEEVKAVLPLETATHHRPVCCTRPAMSSLPSPVKSPTFTSTQLTAVGQLPHTLLFKDDPVDKATSHCPVAGLRPTMSVLPSPLKSPVCTSTHATVESQLPHR